MAALCRGGCGQYLEMRRWELMWNIWDKWDYLDISSCVWGIVWMKAGWGKLDQLTEESKAEEFSFSVPVRRGLEKAMAPHSSTLAWKIPWMEEPGGLQSMGSLRVRHDWATSLSLFTFMHWRMKWQPTPVFLPGESRGQRSLVGCHLWDHTELDTTEAT